MSPFFCYKESCLITFTISGPRVVQTQPEGGTEVLGSPARSPGCGGSVCVRGCDISCHHLFFFWATFLAACKHLDYGWYILPSPIDFNVSYTTLFLDLASRQLTLYSDTQLTQNHLLTPKTSTFQIGVLLGMSEQRNPRQICEQDEKLIQHGLQ